MRAKLYSEKTALEILLSRVERASSIARLEKPCSYLAREELASLEQKINHFSYIEELPLKLTDERELKERFLRAKEIIEKNNQSGRYEQKRLQEDSSVHNFSADRSNKGGRAGKESFESVRRQIEAVVTSPIRIADGSFMKRIGLLEGLLEDARAKGSVHETISLGNYLSLELARIKDTVARHAGMASSKFKDLLVKRGNDIDYASSSVRMYNQRCASLERSIIYLMNKSSSLVEENSITKGNYSIILEAQNGTDRDRLAQELVGSGVITQFKYIPFLAVTTDEKLAYNLLFQNNSMIKRGLVGAYHARVFSVNPLRATRAFQLSEDWNLDLVGAKEAWNTTLGEGARVGIIDTGVDYDHPQLLERFDALKGIDFIDDDPYDYNGHGTHVAGTVAGEHTGVAPRASLYAVRVLNEHGYGSEVGVMKGIEWCIDNDVDVMNLSLGTHLRSSAEEKLIKIAYDKGISVVCAAGNDGDTSYNYPASYFGSISVAAVDQNKKHASFSNRNEEVDLSAPGVSVYSLAPGGGGRLLSGTSMASPHVAGACALVVSAKKSSPEQTLCSTAEKLGERNYFGNGLIRAGEAVK